MQITLKDIIILCTFIATVVGVYSKLRYEIRELKRECYGVKKTLYHENGGLNVLTSSICKQYRDDVFTAIRKGERLTEEITQEMRTLNENVLRIMIHLKIDTPKK